MKDLFGNDIKPDHTPKQYETERADQGALFSKSGLPNQRNLFADIGVPDDLAPTKEKDE